jgi:AcrR family transcriptional regulator
VAVRDPDAKRQRLLEAGLAEFAEHGIAGARMDRIAKLAGCSAGLVYSYFENKEGLFEAVFVAIAERTVAEIAITPHDLPEYAGRLFDSHEAHPEFVRLVTWHQLERSVRIPVVAEANCVKANAIRSAQDDGLVANRFDAAELLVMVFTLSAMWAAEPPAASAAVRAHRRATVVAAVRRLVEP